MTIKVTNSKEAFCAAVDGNDVYIIARAGEDFQWFKHKDADFLVKYQDDEADKKETEAPPAAEPKKLKPKRADVKSLDKGKINALYNAKWPVKKIADEMKCSVATIYRLLDGVNGDENEENQNDDSES